MHSLLYDMDYLVFKSISFEIYLSNALKLSRMATPVFPPRGTTSFMINTLTTSKIVYLPAASTIGSGQMVFIKDICGNAANSTIFISTTGLDTFENINRVSTVNAQMNSNFQSVLLAPDGRINWMILQNYTTNIIPRPINPRPVIATFSYTGGDQTWRVPAFVNMVTIYMWGAGGGSVNDYGGGSGNSSPGGGGGYITGQLPVIPGETLTMIVGQGPGTQNSLNGSSFGTVYGGGGGGDGGGATRNGGSPGGGRSAIRRVGTELVTAGGGAGGYGSVGGAGGGKQGLRADGQARQIVSGAFAGGGSSTLGGIGYQNLPFRGQDGSQFQGGGFGGNYMTSAGGGGWYGGGSAAAYGTGGGGSSYIDNLINGYTEAGSSSNPGGFSNPYRLANTGRGTNTSSRLGHGLIVITYP